jgi:hypothetical protein
VRPSSTPTRSRSELIQRRYRYALHAVVLHVIALHVVALHSPSCCRTRARPGLAASLPRTPELCAFLARVMSCLHRPYSARTLPRHGRSSTCVCAACLHCQRSCFHAPAPPPAYACPARSAPTPALLRACAEPSRRCSRACATRPRCACSTRAVAACRSCARTPLAALRPPCRRLGLAPARLRSPQRACAAPEPSRAAAWWRRGREEEMKHLDGAAAGGEKKRGARIKESRGERQMEFPQGLMHNFRKLQGPFCKA